MPRMHNHGRGVRSGNEIKNLKRLLKDLWKNYKKQLILVIIFLLLASISTTTASIFLAQIINRVIVPVVKGISNDAGVIIYYSYSDVSSTLWKIISLMAIIYVIGIVSAFIYTRMMAKITQGFLNEMRKKTFNHMESLPISYFDTHTHGDIMSIYTNDIDAIRQLVGSSIPSLIQSGTILIILTIIMLTYDI